MSPVIPIYTIGIGQHSAETLLTHLKQHQIGFLIDVRSTPSSQEHPEFNRSSLTPLTKAAGLRYLYLGDTLGNNPHDFDCYDEYGQVDYAVVREKAWFETGIGRLEKAFQQQLRVVLFSNEAAPVKSHRSQLIGHALDLRDIPVVHFDENGAMQPQETMTLYGLSKPSFVSEPVEIESVPTLTGSPLETLKRVFGYGSFRPNQANVIDNILAKKDTLVIMPTGGGKSICYQLPALHMDGLTVVVSPLISLMQDQVTQLTALGVAATFLNSSLAQYEYTERIMQIRTGQTKLLYVAPESLLRPDILQLLNRVNLACLTIDEAHCISSWGHDFRPEYRRLVEVRQQFPQAVCVALTATATPRVRDDIQRSLQFERGSQFISSFDRPNLRIDVRPRETVLLQTVEFVSAHQGQSGIIYCGTRKRVNNISSALAERGVNCLPYHGGMDSRTRAVNQDAFIRDDVPIIVATIAFGMGINKPNVRWVLHLDLPKNVESYYQEIGRAGRDGLPSDCLLLFNYQDVAMQRRFIEQGNPDEAQGRSDRLQALVTWAQSGKCRRIGLLGYFGETAAKAQCGNCDNCLREPVKGEDITILAQKLLSTVLRVHQRFSLTHVIKILRGSMAQPVTKWRHDRLSTHGIGRDLSDKEWKHIGRQMLAQDLMSQEGKFLQLKITSRGRAVLKGEKMLGTRLQTASKVREVARQTLNYEVALFDVLRGKRKVLADAANVPPYAIFSDKSLAEMATYFPHSVASFGRISGIGEKKLAQYAEDFLPLIVTYCKANNLMEHPQLSVRRERVRKERGVTSRSQEVADAYRNGATVEQLRERYGVKRQTIITHLAKVAQVGEALPLDRIYDESYLSPTMQERVLAAYAELGTQAMRPLFEYFNEKVTYEELHVMRIVYWLENGVKSAEPSPNQAADQLFAQLQQLTAQLAQQEGRPPFMLFSSRSLHAMVTHMPRTLTEFAQIDGVGQQRATQYGRHYLDKISTFLAKRTPH